MGAVVLAGSAFLKSNFIILSSGKGEIFFNIVISAFLILTALGLLIVWTMYYLNVQMVTNERIIDINQKSIIHHETTEFSLGKVQDVTTEINGVLANFFGYGNVFVQTAGTEQNFTFDHVASPHKIAKTVLALTSKASAHYKRNLAKTRAVNRIGS